MATAKSPQFPRQVYILTRTYKIRKITLTQPSRWGFGGGRTASGETYAKSAIFDTPKKAIASGKKFIARRERQLLAFRKNLDADIASLAAAEAKL